MQKWDSKYEIFKDNVLIFSSKKLKESDLDNMGFVELVENGKIDCFGILQDQIKINKKHCTREFTITETIYKPYTIDTIFGERQFNNKFELIATYTEIKRG